MIANESFNDDNNEKERQGERKKTRSHWNNKQLMNAARVQSAAYFVHANC